MSEDINPLVNDPEVKVRLMICWNTETQETLDLAGGDGESCSWGEACDHWDGDEVNEEAESKETTEEDDDPGDECEEDGVLWTILSILTSHQRHDCRGSNSDVFAAAEYNVDKASHECWVETILRRQTCHESVGNA